jgi:hypothetical protein
MTHATRFSSLALLASLCVAPAGCSSGSSTPTANDYDDVAQSMSALVGTSSSGGEIHSMSDTVSLALGVTPGALSLNAQGAFGGASGGVNYSYTVTCANATGASLSHCGGATSSAHAAVSWSGNLTMPGVTASVNRTGDYSVSGLQSGHITFDGAGSFSYHGEIQSLFRPEQATSSLSFDAKYAGLTYDATLGHVTGGTITYTVDASLQASSSTSHGGGSFVIDAAVVFAPDGSATITLDGAHVYNVSAAGFLTKKV